MLLVEAPKIGICHYPGLPNSMKILAFTSESGIK
jgi:hypothetical protein